MANYYGNRGNGSSLRHYRTKGSRNGYSKDPNYNPVGQKASGRIVNGRYVYDDPYLSSYGKLQKAGVNDAVRSINNGIKNNWQQQGNYARAGGEAINRAVAGQTRGVRMKINSAQENQAIAGMTAKARRDLSKAGAKNNWQQQADRERAGVEAKNRISLFNKHASKAVYMPRRAGGDAYVTNSPWSIDTERRPIGTTTNINSAHNAQTEAARARSKGSTGLNMNSVHNAQTERERHEAFERVSKGMVGGIIKNRDQIAKGVAKNVQDKLRTANPYGEQKNVSGAMRNDPRYSSNSVVGTRFGNTNKQELAAVGSAVKGAYNKIAHPIDRQVNKLKGTAAKATREVKKTASNVVNKGKATVNNLLKKFKKKK